MYRQQLIILMAYCLTLFSFQNELAVLELFQHLVETLNAYFGRVVSKHTF